jgi:2,3-dihydroxy-2,3-dihydrophenylpropionate dehydrogenase
MSGWLKDYVALVTGGGSGIGRAVTERFVAEGASVTIVGRDLDQLRTVVDECPDPSRVHAVRADVRDSEQLHHAVAETVKQYGKLDTLIANAGMWDYHRQLTKLTAKQLEHAFDEVFAVNVKGYLLAAEACWRELVKTRGSIVMTLSNASFYVNGGGPIYTASKHACLGLMRELAYELAPKLRGPETLGLNTRTLAASFAKKTPDSPPPPIPLHDSSTDPRDFTGSYVLLASREQSGNITGHAIEVDGGIRVRGFAAAAGGDHL